MRKADVAFEHTFSASQVGLRNTVCFAYTTVAAGVRNDMSGKLKAAHIRLRGLSEVDLCCAPKLCRTHPLHCRTVVDLVKLRATV